MIIENALDADITGFHLSAFSSGLPFNIDFHITLTVPAGNCYWLAGQAAALRDADARTRSGGTSSMTPGRFRSSTTKSASTWRFGPTPRSSSTPTSRNPTSRSRCGVGARFASDSCLVRPKPQGDLLTEDAD